MALTLPCQRPESGLGGVPEWLNGAVSKTVVGLTVHRGFESLPLRLGLPADRARGSDEGRADELDVRAQLVRPARRLHHDGRAGCADHLPQRVGPDPARPEVRVAVGARAWRIAGVVR